MAVDIQVSYFFKQGQYKSPNWCKLVNEDNEEKLIVGSVNKIYVKLLSEASASNPINITYEYEEVKETIVADNSNPYILIDLTDRVDLTPIKIKITMGNGNSSYITEQKVTLPCEYLEVSNDTFITAISEGKKIFRLNEDILLDDTLEINNDVIIIGAGQTVSFNNMGTFIIKENVTVKIYDTQFENGTPLFIQENNSSMELNSCTFTNCTASKYEGLGSVVHCDIDLENLSESTDFRTVMENCTFNNCTGAILHDGELIINKCEFTVNDESKIVTTAPSFLYQTGGEASIRNSAFDISLDTDYFCSNHINLKLGQSLILCGESAIINGVTSKYLSKDNALPFFDNPYSNQSHIFVKYYYPSIEDCVYVSPILNRETKNVCYAVSGVDWIFKQNVQITRASWGTENRIGLGE